MSVSTPDATTDATTDAPKDKKPSRLDGFKSLKENPPELPLVSFVTFEPQLLQMAGRMLGIMNDPILFDKLKKVVHKKFDVSIKKLDDELKKGGGESYFTEAECSFFSSNRVI